jgi:N-acetyl-gamma-glutamyl-phosphate reductase
MIRAAIIGASGYSGAELMRLLSSRSDVGLEKVIAGSSAGQRVDALYPAFSGLVGLTFESLQDNHLDDVDVAFVALPSGEAMHIVPGVLTSVGRVIDLGGDFRLRSADLYQEFYKHEHSAPELLSEAIYGLPELHRETIARARLVANPGCYPTSAILGLLPAITSGIIAAEGIVINSLSGVSGAGKSASMELSFVEVNENVRAYKIGTHQHIPEIQEILSEVTGREVVVSFTPHLIPITRGIYTTIHSRLEHSVMKDDVYKIFEEYYIKAPFVRIRKQIPQIKDVAYTNYCDIGVFTEPRTNHLIIISVIDNLVKGAAGQAIQNMNIMFGLPEETGLQ